MTIKWVVRVGIFKRKNRVGRGTGNRHIFFGLIDYPFYYILIIFYRNWWYANRGVRGVFCRSQVFSLFCFEPLSLKKTKSFETMIVFPSFSIFDGITPAWIFVWYLSFPDRSSNSSSLYLRVFFWMGINTVINNVHQTVDKATKVAYFSLSSIQTVK